MAEVSAVFVRGFDFETTKEQVESHCSQAGTVVSVAMKKGNAVVEFSSPEEAQNAVDSLNNSTIPGNSRFIDVIIDKKSLPPKPGMKSSASKAGVKRSAASMGEGKSVFVRGFDFDTTDEQFDAHISSVGTVQDVKWITKGSAVVTYGSKAEAAAAVSQLQGTTIPGNSRFIDVLPREEDNYSPAKKSRIGAKGNGKFMPAWIPNPLLFGGYGAGFGAGFGGGTKFKPGQAKKKKGDHKDEDPAGSGRVFVRGFDFGTDDAKFEKFMSKAGAIHTVHWVSKGSAVVVYKKQASAIKASTALNQTTIPGNTRYVDVILKD